MKTLVSLYLEMEEDQEDAGINSSASNSKIQT
jgi:hypothetical protein